MVLMVRVLVLSMVEKRYLSGKKAKDITKDT